MNEPTLAAVKVLPRKAALFKRIDMFLIFLKKNFKKIKSTDGNATILRRIKQI